jgi:hypothetical protein
VRLPKRKSLLRLHGLPFSGSHRPQEVALLRSTPFNHDVCTLHGVPAVTVAAP